MSLPEPIDRMLAWAYAEELLQSRFLWRLEWDSRLPEPWPYAGAWFDPAGAALLDLSAHPYLGGGAEPWFQAGFDDLAGLELLLAVRLPERCQLMADTRAEPVLRALGQVELQAILEVHACPPGELGEAAIAYHPTRLTTRHRALCAEADWRPEDLPDEQDEESGGMRWALLRDGHIASRLLVQRVSRGVAELADVETARAYRRRGYGAALVQAMVRRLHERELTVTYSNHPDNAPSLALAAAVGFKPLMSWGRYRLRRA